MARVDAEERVLTDAVKGQATSQRTSYTTMILAPHGIRSVCDADVLNEM